MPSTNNEDKKASANRWLALSQKSNVVDSDKLTNAVYHHKHYKILKTWENDLKRLKINYVEYHNRCIKKAEFYSFVADYYDHKERFWMHVPILMLNGMSSLFANEIESAILPVFPYPTLLLIIRQALPILVTLYIGLKVHLKWGRKAEQYHNAANDFKVLQNQCYFKLQSLDLFFLIKTNKGRVDFIKNVVLEHDSFFHDANKKEERAAKASSPINDRIRRRYHDFHRKEMKKLAKGLKPGSKKEKLKQARNEFGLKEEYLNLDDELEKLCLENNNHQARKGYENLKNRTLTGKLANVSRKKVII